MAVESVTVDKSEQSPRVSQDSFKFEGSFVISVSTVQFNTVELKT